MLFIQEGCIKLIKKVTVKECIMLQEFCISIKYGIFVKINYLFIQSQSWEKMYLGSHKNLKQHCFQYILKQISSFTTYHDYLIVALLRTV